MPIALFHFHKAGLYGAVANLIAIPLTTFVIMPAEALALLLDVFGLGAPFWWVAAKAIKLLLVLAHDVAGQPGAMALLPSVPTGAFAAMIAGALWLLIWRGRIRLIGAGPMIAGLIWAIIAPAPDILVTYDGRHVVIRDDAGQFAILRPRSGDFVRQALSERAAYSGDLEDLDTARRTKCSADSCLVRLSRGGRDWQILMIRSRHKIKWQDIVLACKNSDLVVADRVLPLGCRPRWVRVDPPFLAKTGGLAISLNPLSVHMTKSARTDHPWINSGGVLAQ
jgi:competence protein ComEC